MMLLASDSIISFYLHGHLRVVDDSGLSYWFQEKCPDLRDVKTICVLESRELYHSGCQNDGVYSLSMAHNYNQYQFDIHDCNTYIHVRRVLVRQVRFMCLLLLDH